MTHRFEGERTLMRVFIGESDRCLGGAHKGKPLYEALVDLFRERGFAGATVLRGITGFGASAKVHTDRILRLSLDLPIVVEVVDSEERIQEILPELDDLIGGGLITLERAHVILYRPSEAAEDDRARRRTEGLDPGDDQVDSPSGD
jgi:hypothetical protein